MKTFITLALVALCSIPVLAAPSKKAVPSELDSLAASLHQSRQQMIEALDLATTPQEKRLIVEQWRQENEPLLERQRFLLKAESDDQQQLARQSLGASARPAIPTHLPPEERRRLELQYELQDSRMALSAQLENASPEERRQIIEAFRQQNAETMASLRELSEGAPQAKDNAIGAAQSGDRERIGPPQALELIPIPENLPADDKARLQARNERIQAQNELREALDSGTPEERRQAIEAYREKMGAPHANPANEAK